MDDKRESMKYLINCVEEKQGGAETLITLCKVVIRDSITGFETVS